MKNPDLPDDDYETEQGDGAAWIRMNSNDPRPCRSIPARRCLQELSIHPVQYVQIISLGQAKSVARTRLQENRKPIGRNLTARRCGDGPKAGR